VEKLIFLKRLIGALLIIFLLNFTPCFADENINEINLPVPYFNQGVGTWAKENITNNKTIAQIGCLMVSSCMVLNYYLAPQGKNTDPFQLNRWLKTNGGYDENGNLYVPKIAEYASKNFNLALNNKQLWKAPPELEIKNYLSQKIPPIGKVYNQRLGNHWVVVRGYSDGKFLINDPAWQNRTSLDDYFNLYKNKNIKTPTPIPADLIVFWPKNWVAPTPPQNPISEPRTISVIIDDSGSMMVNDPDFWRKKAVFLFIDKTEPGDFLLIDKFADTPSEICQSKAGIEENKETKRKLEENLKSEGATDIEGALNQAFQKLSLSEGKEKFAILLTDGAQTVGDSVVDPESYLQFKKKGWKIYIIALLPKNANATQTVDPFFSFGYTPDIPLLKEIARQTNGEYIETKNEQELITIYNRILGRIKKVNLLQDKAFILKPKQQKIQTFSVAPQTTKLVITTIWYGSDIETYLFSPSGKKVEAQVIKEENYQVLTVERPQPGKWKAIIKAIEVPPEGELVNFTAEAKIDKNKPYIEFLGPYEFFQKSPFVVKFKIQDESPLYKITVTQNKKTILNFEGSTKTENYKLDVGEESSKINFKIEAEDMAGNKSLYLWTYFIDNTSPSIAAFKIIPTSFWEIRKMPYFYFKLEEKQTSLKAVKITILTKGGKKIFEKKYKFQPFNLIEEKYKITLPENLPAGKYQIIIEAEDMLGNKKVKEKYFSLFTLKSIINWLESFF